MNVDSLSLSGGEVSQQVLHSHERTAGRPADTGCVHIDNPGSGADAFGPKDNFTPLARYATPIVQPGAK